MLADTQAAGAQCVSAEASPGAGAPCDERFRIKQQNASLHETPDILASVVPQPTDLPQESQLAVAEASLVEKHTSLARRPTVP